MQLGSHFIIRANLQNAQSFCSQSFCSQIFLVKARKHLCEIFPKTTHFRFKSSVMTETPNSCIHQRKTSGPYFMALLTVSKESQLMNAVNSTLTSSIFHKLGANVKRIFTGQQKLFIGLGKVQSIQLTHIGVWVKNQN